MGSYIRFCSEIRAAVWRSSFPPALSMPQPVTVTAQPVAHISADSRGVHRSLCKEMTQDSTVELKTGRNETAAVKQTLL